MGGSSRQRRPGGRFHPVLPTRVFLNFDLGRAWARASPPGGGPPRLQALRQDLNDRIACGEDRVILELRDFGDHDMYGHETRPPADAVLWIGACFDAYRVLDRVLEAPWVGRALLAGRQLEFCSIHPPTPAEERRHAEHIEHRLDQPEPSEYSPLWDRAVYYATHAAANVTNPRTTHPETGDNIGNVLGPRTQQQLVELLARTVESANIDGRGGGREDDRDRLKKNIRRALQRWANKINAPSVRAGQSYSAGITRQLIKEGSKHRGTPAKAARKLLPSFEQARAELKALRQTDDQ